MKSEVQIDYMCQIKQTNQAKPSVEFALSETNVLMTSPASGGAVTKGKPGIATTFGALRRFSPLEFSRDKRSKRSDNNSASVSRIFFWDRSRSLFTVVFHLFSSTSCQVSGASGLPAASRANEYSAVGAGRSLLRGDTLPPRACAPGSFGSGGAGPGTRAERGG